MQLASTTEPSQTLILPPGNITMRAYVCDVINSCTNILVSRMLVPPVIFSSASSKAYSADVVKTIKSGNVDKFLLSALSAATAIMAQSSSQVRNRRLTQVCHALRTSSFYQCFYFQGAFENNLNVEVQNGCGMMICGSSEYRAEF